MQPTFVLNTPASSGAIAALTSKYALPASYTEFLSRSNGAEGDLSIDPGWFVVWSAESALVASDEYKVPLYLPGHFAFGSNGGGELFLLELGRGADSPIYIAPAIGMDQGTRILIARSWATFASAMGSRLAP